MSASGYTVEYIINLRDEFSAAAARIGKMAAEAKAAIGGLGKTANEIDGQMKRAAEAVNKVAASTQRAKAAMGEFTQANSRAAQDAARANELWVKEQGRIEKIQQRVLERQTAMNQLREKGLIPAKGGGAAREVGIMGGLFGLSMLHTDVLDKWMQFDDVMRRIQGTMAGQLSNKDLAELRQSAMEVSKGSRFAPSEIAKILLSEAERGVPVNERTADNRLLGAVIAKQMLGIATGTGEDPAKTFETHLAIARGFEMPFSKFPHISDTIARIHQKTGISLKQIETQMGQIASFAHLSGWSEEQTVGALGYLAKRGMGQYAGSGLARLISKSQAWSKPAAEFWKSLGISKEDVIDAKTGGMIAPDKMIDLLRAHTKGMRGAEIAAAFTKMFGDRGQKIAAAFAGADSRELREMIADLSQVQGLAEKMGDEGSKGGAAGIARFSAALDRMRTAIGESGYGDWIGNLGRRFANLFDAISDGPSLGKNVIGGVTAAIDGLSKAALPLLAISTMWPLASGGIKSLSSSLAGLGGLGALAGDATRLATALRLLSGITVAGIGVVATEAVIANWDNIAATADKAYAALKKLYSGDWKGGAKDLWDVATKANADLAATAGRLPGTPDPDKMKSIWDYAKEKPQDPNLKMPHGSRWYQPPPSAQGAAAAANSAEATRIKVESTVKATLDPLKVDIPGSVTLQGTMTGPNGASAQVSGKMPISASSPRGTTMADPAAPVVTK